VREQCRGSTGHNVVALRTNLAGGLCSCDAELIGDDCTMDSSTRPLVLVVTFTTNESTRDELLMALTELARLSVLEDGCVRYELHHDDADPLRFTFVETWATDAHHAVHDSTAHVRDFVTDIPRLTTGAVTVQRLRPA
jgi:quinol monooxygenase YgiN